MSDRARLSVDMGHKCGRNGCDGTVDRLHTEHLRVKAHGLTLLADDPDSSPGSGFDVLIGLCGKCKRALAEGRWTPTRQADRERWKPSEKQLHTTVMGALNRDLFKVPPEQWFFEIGFLATKNTGKAATADLLCILHGSGYSRLSKGLHAIEVKHEHDLGAKRLGRQLENFQNAADYVWLLSLGDPPEFDDDERIGLLAYDHKKDQVTKTRDAQHTDPQPHYRDQLFTNLQGRLSKCEGRMKELAPQAVNKRLDEVAP